MNTSLYTPWQKIFSYDASADMTFVIEARGHGKTFGIREQLLRDYINHKWRFAIVVRTETRIPIVANDFFGALAKPNNQGEYSSELWRNHRFIFKRSGYTLQCQEIPVESWTNPDWSADKDKWDTIGYFVSLSKAQNYKELTFTKVRRIVFDEALIERPDAHNAYLPNEFESFNSLVYSIFREQVDGTMKPNIYCLANACSVVNPYFSAYNVDRIPPKGFSWWSDKQLLIYNGDTREYSQQMATNTIAGRMAQHTAYARMSLDNDFKEGDYIAFIAPKTSQARFIFAIAVSGKLLGVWVDMAQGMYYINQKMPRGNDYTVFALTSKDNRINYVMAQRGELRIRSIAEMYASGNVRFDTFETMQLCLDNVFTLYGMR